MFLDSIYGGLRDFRIDLRALEIHDSQRYCNIMTIRDTHKRLLQLEYHFAIELPCS